ncbi:MAG TPA: FG-GAP-like repeat-containing protein [Opitutaceae bacterium]|nr:FG-GAP-like repeat-containing protein [Opitutaceae bacterium]
MFATEYDQPAARRLVAVLKTGRRIMLAGALLVVSPAWAGDAGSGIVRQPLAPLSGPRGATMFLELDSAQTGIVTENRYADPTMWGERYPQFAFGSTGTGVAIGDYDGDGRPDIFVVNKTESCQLFRNLGGWRFEDVTDKAGVRDQGGTAGIWNEGVTFVDVNNDGRLDIYVCRFNAPNLLYINQGDGTFREMAHAYGLDVTDACVQASFCDYDRDGWLDVYIQTNLLDPAGHPQGQRDYLFHNNRDGTFTNVTDQAGISGETQGHSATWWDYDNDGWPDLYVANDFGAPDQLYHNNRDGTFTNVIDRVVPHMPFSSMGSDLGDVNNDGLIDFLAADMAATTHEKDQRGMADTRGFLKDPPAGSIQPPQYQRSALFLNTNTGRCLEAAMLAGLNATDWTWSPRFEDLDNDGRLDLFVTNGMNREQTNADLLVRAFAAGSPMEYVRVMRDSPLLAESHLAFRNLGDLHFENASAAWGLNQNGVSFGSAFGDLDGDGDLDLVYANYQKGVTVLRNDCQTGHRVIIALRGTQSNRFGVGAMVRLESAAGTQVRQLWLARGYKSSSEPILHFGLGDDTRINRLIVTWPSGIVQTFTDLPADRRFTITEPDVPAAVGREVKPPAPGQFAEVTDTVGLVLGSREGVVDETSVQPLLPHRLNRRGPALAVGIINEDGRDDVVVGGTTLDPLRMIRNAGAGQFIPETAGPAAAAAPIDDGPVLLFDATGSGRDDLLVTRGGNAVANGSPDYQPQLFLNNGQGGFRPAPDGTLPPLPVNAGALAAADFNRDGRLDLFVGGRVRTGHYPLAPRSALLVNRGGRFEDVTDTLAPGLREVGMVTSALWTDVDGDGWLDLLIALEWGQVKYFHNDQGARFEDWTEKAGFAAAGTGWWNSIAAADFNGDGQPDYVVGNVGLNTQYRADAVHPALLFSGDFDGRGTPQLIEAYFEGNRLYPWRTRRDLGAAIPSILRRFPRNDSYARATLNEILGDDRLAAAQQLAATELRSGVFLSQPDGTYRFKPLPRLAQIAPIQGLVAGDFDGDGNADIYAVQNSFAPVPAVGRFDGGLSQLLRGDGHGHFLPVPPAESNLVVTGDAKALAVLDLDEDGWPDFLITRNNSTMLAYRNQGVPGRRFLRISLRGPAGNPTAVGARITVELTGGSTQTSEVYAGSGYYSQSTAACFFGYPDSSPPRHIRVRWPSGIATEYDGPPRSATLTLAAPKS